jgi:hypothetical protein
MDESDPNSRHGSLPDGASSASIAQASVILTA